jgi:hypothetical protein
MPVSTLTEFHHWLLSEESPGAPFLILYTRDQPAISCADAIARLLNEYDDRSNGNWIAIHPEVVHAIAADAAQRRLLGIADACPNCPPTSECGIRKVLAALAKRGHIVFDHPSALQAVGDNSRGFLAAVGAPPQEDIDRYHLIIQPKAFDSRCIPSLIGDSFLEWTNSHCIA